MQPNALLVRVCWVALISAIVWAERLPLRTYSNADGVPSSTVNCIENDRRGFLWLCSYDGLIRFDGHKFVSYGPADGLPDRIVTAFLETTKGEYWVGTLKGLARFEPEASRHGRAPFATQRLGVEQDALHITALVEGPDGAIWCGTRKGLYRLDAKAGFDRVEIGLPKRNWTTDYVKALAVDKAGALWIGTGWSGLYRRKSNGLIDHVAKPPLIEGITVDHRGSVWVAASGGVHRFDDN